MEDVNYIYTYVYTNFHFATSIVGIIDVLFEITFPLAENTTTAFDEPSRDYIVYI